MNRRSMLGSLAAALLAPFALKARAAAVVSLTPHEAGLCDGDHVMNRWVSGTPSGDAKLTSLAADVGRVNVSALEVSLAGCDRPVLFPPETLMLSSAVRTVPQTDYEWVGCNYHFTYKASGFNSALHPDGSYRRLSPAPYATSDFKAFHDAAGRGIRFEKV